MNKIIQYGGVEAIPLYNCSGMTPELWTHQFGEKRPIIGSISIVYGMIMEILFIPCLLVISESDLFSISCYKIMFVVGIVDMLALGMNSIVTGFLALEGAVFCTHPVLIYLTGLAGLGLWCSSCLMNILLLINRTLNISDSRIGNRLFGGNRTYIALLIPILYGLYFVFFTNTCVFSSKYYAWFYDPFIFPDKTAEYTNFSHGFNNGMIMVGTFFFYGYICFELFKASRAHPVDKIQTQSHSILYQSIAICVINQISSSVYVAMNFVVVPEWLILLAQLLWQLDHGCPVIIYMTMNRTIRGRFLRKVLCQKGTTQVFVSDKERTVQQTVFQKSAIFVQAATVRPITHAF